MTTRTPTVNPRAWNGRRSSEPLLPLDGLRFWVLREVLIQHCHARGLDAWFRLGGKLHVVGLTPAVIEDRFRVEHVLQLRVSREEYIDADALLTARHKTQWQTFDPISDPDIRGRATGQPAVRLAGDGPRRGWVNEVNGDRLVLGAGERHATRSPQPTTRWPSTPAS